jgi:hypothetical protein
MSKLFITLLFLATQAMAGSVQEAKGLWEKRGDDKANALKSAEMYKELADSESDQVRKTELTTFAAESYYYVASHAADNADTIDTHDMAQEMMADSYKAFQAEKSDVAAMTDSEKNILARAMYFYGANLGAWGSAAGIGVALPNWPKLKRSMEYIIKVLKKGDVEDYGPFRILGRAYYKVPSLPRSTNWNKSLKYLERGYKKTLNAKGQSTYGLFAIYYADTLKVLKRAPEGKKVLESFIASLSAGKKDASVLNPSRVPENLDDLVVAKKSLANF